MRIFWFAVVCILVGMLVGNRMTTDGDLPGCTTPKAVVTTGK
jgi:hypothetical protein